MRSAIGDAIHVDVDGQNVESASPRRRRWSRRSRTPRAGGEGASALVAPMPGRVIAVRAAEGAPVQAGQAIVVIEAMKMEHAVASPIDGRVDASAVREGEQVSAATSSPRSSRREIVSPMTVAATSASTRSGRATGSRTRPAPIPTDAKLRFIEPAGRCRSARDRGHQLRLARAIPQLADADDLMARLERRPGVRYPVLVPNERGLDRAEAAGADAICVFTAASEAFTQHNINMTIAESLDAFGPVVAARARARLVDPRLRVSTAFGCPYQGEVDERAVVDVAQRLLALGVDELSIGDTIGVAVSGRRAPGRRRVDRGRDRRRSAWRCTSTTRAARRSPT